MDAWIVENQYWCRFGIFLIIFSLLAWWETKACWRPWLVSRRQRWLKHLSLSFLSKLCLRFIFPLFAVGFALTTRNNKIGLMTTSALPFWAQVVLGLIVMDFVIYMQHRFMHKYTWFWLFHKVHHIDNQVDISTGLRFHPIEEMYTLMAKMVGVGICGIPVLAVFLYEIWLNTATLYTHLNVSLNPKTEKWLRYLIVTPGMHRVHHSDIPSETNSNYGFGLSIWDKLFGSYVPFPHSGERKLVFGLEEYHSPKYQTLENMLLLPFGLRKLKVWPKKVHPTKMKDHEKLLR
jgi:sterol desaturase/sphingolipid hydroxylase (fatty acid hydroxylase superfamily)